MKWHTLTGVVLFVGGIVLALLQLWFTPWSPDLFFKIEATVGAALAIVAVIGFVARESAASKALRSGERED